MAEDEDKKSKRHRCGACFGEGGEWVETNGQAEKKKEWRSCRACGGSGWQDA